MRPRIVRTAIETGTTLVVSCLLLSGSASAQGTDQPPLDEQIVLSGRLVIAEGESVEAAVIFHGPATIDGTVRESLVVFDGRAEISGTVDGDVVVFNGPVVVRSGATIGGDLVTVETPTVEPGATIRGEQRGVQGRFDLGDIGFAGRFAWWVGYSVSTLLLGMLLLLVAPALDVAIARAAREKTGASIGLGAAAFFLLPLAAVLFLVIVVAIPLGLFLLLALALLYTVSYVVAAHALGRRLAAPPTSRFLAFLAGWAILRGLGLIPVVGGLVWILASIFGLGVLWVAARRSVPEPPATPEMPPMPTPAQG
ncbi:MAG: hypothetical protein ACRDHI_00410 [Actinomycetota bacterium]